MLASQRKQTPLVYRNIKSQDYFYDYPNKLTKPTLTNLSTRLPVNKLTTLHCKYFYRTSPNSLQPFAFSLRWKGNRAYSTSFPDAIFVSSRVRAYHIYYLVVELLSAFVSDLLCLIPTSALFLPLLTI